ncbi:hypothetical protein J7L67_09225 [bacterium]|nr:hypothetical protein [bacterium]
MLRKIKNSITAAVDWLCRSYTLNSQKGISEYYSSTGNWSKPSAYVTAETAGLFSHLEKSLNFFEDKDFGVKSVELANWASESQLDSAAVPAGVIGSSMYPSVLRTAQAVKGWIEVYTNTGNERSIVCAIRAGEWLCANQDGDGSWRSGLNDELGGIARVFNVAASYALALLRQETKIEKFKEHALFGLEWAVHRQTDNGWFKMNSSDSQTQDSSLRNIGYTVLSLLGCAEIFNNDKYLKSAEKAVESMLKWQRLSGDFPSRFNHKNNPTISRHCCLGTAQMAKSCFLIYRKNKKEKFLEAGKKAVDFLINIQDLNSKYDGIKGAVPVEKNKKIFFAETVNAFIEAQLIGLEFLI